MRNRLNPEGGYNNYNNYTTSAAQEETYAPLPNEPDMDQFGRRRGSSASATSNNFSTPASSTSSASSAPTSKHGQKKFSNSNRNSRMGSTVAVFVIFLINITLITLSRGWFDTLLYIFCAVLVGGLRGFSKLPKRYLSGIGILLLVTPCAGWCCSFLSEMFSSNGDSSTSNGASSGASSSSSSSSSFSSASSSSIASAFTTTSSSQPVGATETILVPVYSTIEGAQPLTLHCPPRAVISSIDFSSYGTPKACVGWRSTTGCDPEGPRDNTTDLTCDQSVPAGRSGFCECSDGSKRVLSKCNHPVFTCKQECERVVTCIGFRATTNCNPHQGTASPTIASCNEIVAPHVSGFCECSNGTRVSHSTCDHDPFTCQQKCTEGAAKWPPFAMDQSCHHSKSLPIIEQQCPTGRTSCALGPEWRESLFEFTEHQGNHDPCPGKPGNRRLHVRMTCTQRQQVKKKKVSVGEICRSTTDAFKLCMEHHIVAEAIKCQLQYTKVLECQSKAASLV